MSDLTGFNAHDVDPQAPADPVPAGKYVAMIVESESKPTKDNAGSFLELVFQIAEGQHKGRKLWARLNLQNRNSQAVQIARAELSAICRAVGVMTPKDSIELHNIPLVLTVKCKKRTDNGDITNEIRGYESKSSASAAAKPAASPAANDNTPPWKR